MQHHNIGPANPWLNRGRYLRRGASFVKGCLIGCGVLAIVGVLWWWRSVYLATDYSRGRSVKTQSRSTLGFKRWFAAKFPNHTSQSSDSTFHRSGIAS